MSTGNDYVTGSVVDGPVGIVLVRAIPRPNAMTVSFFSEVAHHPTSLWISIAKTAHTHALIEASRAFSLAVLHQQQKNLALACGTVSGRDKDKCAALKLYDTPTGFLFLEEALSSTACRVRDTVSFDSHTIFIADILEGQVESRRSHLRHLLVSDL